MVKRHSNQSEMFPETAPVTPEPGAVTPGHKDFSAEPTDEWVQAVRDSERVNTRFSTDTRDLHGTGIEVDPAGLERRAKVVGPKALLGAAREDLKVKPEFNAQPDGFDPEKSDSYRRRDKNLFSKNKKK